MLQELENFYQSKEEPHRSCLFALRDIILATDENMTETRKYGMPCFCYEKKALVYLWTDKKTSEPYLLLVKGNQIDHPRLETGDRKRMKILRVNPKEDIEVQLIQSLLDQSISLK